MKTQMKRLRHVNMYGEGIGFNFKGYSTYSTWIGFIMTILSLITIINYSIDKLIVLLERGDTTYRGITKHDVLDDTRDFTLEELGLSEMIKSVINFNLPGIETFVLSEYLEL